MKTKNYTAGDVTIAVINYNGIDKIPDLFASVKRLRTPAGEVIMVDDGSTDGSPDWVRGHHPDVRVVPMTKNSKVKNMVLLNMVRNVALGAAENDLVFMVDNDVVLEENCLDEALQAMNTLPGAAVCMPRAVYENQPDIIYQDGQILHYIGASPNINRDRPVAEADTTPRISIGWGVQLIDRKQTEDVGWFNESYYLGWGDDGEFNHKLNMMGRNCYHVPLSVVLHKRHGASKRYEAAVINRWRFIINMYELKTIILAAPAFFLYEMMLFGFLLMKRVPGTYFRGMLSVLGNLPQMCSERKTIQTRRTVPDRELMGSGDIFVYSDEVSSTLLKTGYKLLNCVLNFYWRVIRNFV